MVIPQQVILSVGFNRIEELEEALLPNFFIGAHAVVEGLRLLTRPPATAATFPAWN